MRTRKFLKTAVKAPLHGLLRVPALRSRVIFEIRQRYYSELEVVVPLGHGLQCPISSSEHLCSFTEVFFAKEYEDTWRKIPLPTRWLDLGCHAGYFSLYVAWLRRQQRLAAPCAALLVDADSRCGPAVHKLITLNGLSGLAFEHGAVSRKPGKLRFYKRGFMSSAAAGLGGEHGGE